MFWIICFLSHLVWFGMTMVWYVLHTKNEVTNIPRILLPAFHSEKILVVYLSTPCLAVFQIMLKARNHTPSTSLEVEELQRNYRSLSQLCPKWWQQLGKMCLWFHHWIGTASMSTRVQAYLICHYFLYLGSCSDIICHAECIQWM